MTSTAQESFLAGLEAWNGGDFDATRVALTSAVDEGDLPEAHVLLGVLDYAVENFAAAREHFERAYTAFREADNLRGAAMAATNLGSLHYDGLGNEAASRGWLSRASRLLDRAGRCVERGYHELALVACNVRDASALQESAAVALDLAIEFNDPDLEARALADGGLAMITQGNLEKGFARLDEAMAPVSSGEVRNPMIAGTVFCALLTACERTGELRRAEEWTRACEEFASRLTGRIPVLHAHCRVAYGTVLCDAGRFTEAELELLDALGGKSQTGFVPKQADAAGLLATLRLLQGRVDEAAELLGPHEDRFEVCEPLARLHIARGDFDLAAGVVSRALGDLVGDRLRGGRLLRLLVDVELGRGDLDAADVAAERLADYAEGSDSAILRAESALADGRVALARGNAASAVDTLENGLAQLPREERPILAATIRLEFAKALETSGDAAAAADQARAAMASFQRVGADAGVARASELVGRLAASAPAAR